MITYNIYMPNVIIQMKTRPLLHLYSRVKWWQHQIHSASVAAPAFNQKTHCNLRGLSLLYSSSLPFWSLLMSSLWWKVLHYSLWPLDSWGSLMLWNPFIPCFLLLLCKWMNCSGNTQCPFVAFQCCHFEAQDVNISPGRWVCLTCTCSFTQLNHSHIHCCASVNICCKPHKGPCGMILLSNRGSFTV